MKAGVVETLTPTDCYDALQDTDLVCLMSAIWFGGQAFIEYIPKSKRLKGLNRMQKPYQNRIDGGVNSCKMPQPTAAGADVLAVVALFFVRKILQTIRIENALTAIEVIPILEMVVKSPFLQMEAPKSTDHPHSKIK